MSRLSLVILRMAKHQEGRNLQHHRTSRNHLFPTIVNRRLVKQGGNLPHPRVCRIATMVTTDGLQYRFRRTYCTVIGFIVTKGNRVVTNSVRSISSNLPPNRASREFTLSNVTYVSRLRHVIEVLRRILFVLN